MRLLDKLIQKRDAHLAAAGKFSDMIALLEGDQDFAKDLHKGKLAIVNGAKHQFTALRGSEAAPVEKPKKKTKHASSKFKKAMSRRMKKLWREKRDVMMKGVRKGSKNGQATMRAKRLAEAATMA